MGLGSNLGDRQNYLNTAIMHLSKNGCHLLKQSTYLETEPVGGPPHQGLFLNGVIKIETQFSPHELLTLIHQIESQLHRVRNIENGPRTIDIDILIFDQLTINEPNLKIPHPRIKEREFVLKPLAEIAPEESIHFADENI